MKTPGSLMVTDLRRRTWARITGETIGFGELRSFHNQLDCVVYPYIKELKVLIEI